MGKSKSDTIASYLDAFLSQKSEKYREKFLNKNEAQQYAAIMQWKSNAKKLGMATKNLAKVTTKDVVAHLKDAYKKLTSLDNLSPSDQVKLVGMIDKMKGAIDDFDRIKKRELLKNLQNEKEQLSKKGTQLDQEIEKLLNELA